jgi:hypothetical protein
VRFIDVTRSVQVNVHHEPDQRKLTMIAEEKFSSR